MTKRGHPVHPYKTYDVGFKRPPVETRFKKGRSGNPNGRPRRTQTAHDSIAQILAKKIVVNVKGKTRKITIGEGIIQQLTAKALKGNLRVAKFLFENANCGTNNVQGDGSNKKALIDALMAALGDGDDEAK